MMGYYHTPTKSDRLMTSHEEMEICFIILKKKYKKKCTSEMENGGKITSPRIVHYYYRSLRTDQ